MAGTSEVPAAAYALAWISLAVIFAFYLFAAITFRWRIPRKTTVTRYEPPKEISPAMAAYLLENGRGERAFAAALVSLAVKGYLIIQQQKDWFILDKLRNADASLPAEESTVLRALFPGSERCYTFNGLDCARAYLACQGLDEELENIADPELMSSHTAVWACGVACSVAIPIWMILAFPVLKDGTSLKPAVFLGFWILLGGSCFVAALRVWPATLRKLISLFPGDSRPRRPLEVNDLVPITLTASSLLGFAFLLYLTSMKFALLVVGLVILNFVFRNLLEAPTSSGRKALAELRGFREFLSRADADRLNRENQPGQTPQVLEKYSAYAIALGVENGWGEELTSNLLELLQIDEAYRWHGPNLPVVESGPIELKISPRK